LKQYDECQDYIIEELIICVLDMKRMKIQELMTTTRLNTKIREVSMEVTHKRKKNNAGLNWTRMEVNMQQLGSCFSSYIQLPQNNC
jgi:hypothetical protein